MSAILATFTISEFYGVSDFLLSALNMDTLSNFTNSTPYLKTCVFLWIPCSDYIAIVPYIKDSAIKKFSHKNLKESRMANCK